MKLMQTITAFDIHLFSWVMRRKTQKFQVHCARWISKSADGPLYVLLGAALLYSKTPSDLALFYSIVLGLLMERPLYAILKNLCRRDRPPVVLNIQSFIVPSDRFSFPSGHTSAAFLVATCLSYFHPPITPALLTWASLVGMARVVLGVHFPTDTFIGALMGSGLALLSLEILNA